MRIEDGKQRRVGGGADDEFPRGDRKVRGNINAMEQKNFNSTLGDLEAG